MVTDAFGLIYTGESNPHMRDLTMSRAVAALPFGGRYRVVDFILSDLVHSGITSVGVITQKNYHSLMDHLGSGKEWDLHRKREGLFILPPFGLGNNVYQSRIEALDGVSNFLRQCKEEYVIMSDCHIIFTMDFTPVLDEHIAKNADLTIVYKNSAMPADLPEPVRLELGRGRKVTEVIDGGEVEGKSNWSMGVYIAKKSFLLKVVSESIARNRLSFIRDVLQRGSSDYRIYGYRFEGFTGVLGSMKGFFDQNMALMNAQVRADLFPVDRPVYTKVRDEMPTRFGLGSHVVNSLVADGCLIEGDVENCVLFRGVRVGKGAKLRNCIIMQDSIVGNNISLNYVIGDKDVVYKDGRTLMGYESYPVYIAKGSVV